MANFRSFSITLCMMILSLTAPLLASGEDGEVKRDQEATESTPEYSFSGDAALVSKYIWRGQRLTNDWSLQPGAALGIGSFSFSVWGNLDLTAVNEGDSLFLPQNPLAPPGDHDGLQGQFSEVDFTGSYGVVAGPASLDFGTIIYTFPNRSASLPATVEVYGGATFDQLPLTPSATLYVDVDETGASGDTGLYFLLGAAHKFPFGLAKFPGIELSGTLSFVNGGFGQFYYGADEAGIHDAAVTLAAPVNLGENWSLSGFITYSALIGDFRQHQFQDAREVYRGTAGSPAAFADTLWGGVSVSLGF